MRSIWMGVAAGLVAATMAQAQQAELDVGARVRVFAPSLAAKGLEGTVAHNGDTLVLVVSGARVRIPATVVQRLELSRGRSGADGARRGVVWGAAFGAVLGAISTEEARYALGGSCVDSEYECDGTPTAGQRVTYVGTMIIGGAVWGALIGAIVGRERWDAIPIERVAVTPLPSGGVGVQVRVGRSARLRRPIS
jgi:hypothetical protein